MDTLYDILSKYHCECGVRSVDTWSDGIIWHCACHSCGKLSLGKTHEEAVQNWRDARDMKKVRAWYKDML